ncbi:TLC domain-containing protein [Geopyxis carbonaria]|nr:TLC domain-containing protein [Geopyxis carbonaria]
MEVFTLPCPPALSKFAEAFAEKYSLPTFPLHVHQVLIAFVAYHTIYIAISPLVSKICVPGIYNSFPRRTQINWDVHVVSFVQSVFICALALWGMFNDHDRNSWDNNSEDSALYRVFGYTVTGGAVQGYAAGYFLWDLMISVYHVKIMGWGFVAHAISALLVFGLGFRPFVNYYAPIFILFELSSPFLNIHWFCDKLNLTGSRIQLVNGFFLLGTFFLCRIVWGTYNSVLVFKDVFNIYATPPPSAHPKLDPLSTQETPIDGAAIHPFAGMTVPLWLVVVYLGSNICLNGLNYFWFSRMIQTVSARFQGPKKVKVDEDEKVWIEGADMDFASPAELVKMEAHELHRRYVSKDGSKE